MKDNPKLDPIQNKCVYGYVLPDRCRYMRHLGCPCGAYLPKHDNFLEKISSQIEE